MVQKRLTIDYQEYASMAEMEEADRSLLERAVKATEGSYAPYSKYNVGAVVLLSDGTVVTGANQENAAFPFPEPAWPCGACRQVLAESQKRAGAPVRVIVGGLSRIVVFSCVEDILPFIFNGL